jgi:hypothetical protein
MLLLLSPNGAGLKETKKDKYSVPIESTSTFPVSDVDDKSTSISALYLDVTSS